MHMKTTIALLLGLALVGSTEFASAQQGRGRGPAGPRPPQQPPAQPQEQQPAPQSFPPAIAALFDKDSNGILSPAEISATAEVLRALDTNTDGQLTKEELCVGACPNGQECPAGQVPANGPGQGRGRGFGARKGPGPGAGHPPILFGLFDADRDGKLSTAEVNNAPAALSARDANADAQITPDELRPPAGGGRGPGPRGAKGPMSCPNTPVEQ
jgi:hypothetical protein